MHTPSRRHLAAVIALAPVLLLAGDALACSQTFDPTRRFTGQHESISHLSLLSPMLSPGVMMRVCLYMIPSLLVLLASSSSALRGQRAAARILVGCAVALHLLLSALILTSSGNILIPETILARVLRSCGEQLDHNIYSWSYFMLKNMNNQQKIIIYASIQTLYTGLCLIPGWIAPNKFDDNMLRAALWFIITPLIFIVSLYLSLSLLDLTAGPWLLKAIYTHIEIQF